MFAVLAAARFAHFAAICLLFGMATFPFYAVPKGGEPPRLRRVLGACAGLALATAIAELAVMAGNMGGSLGAMWDPQVVSAAVSDTRFGRVWLLRIGIAALVLVLSMRRGAARSPALAIGTGALLASVALTGHSALPGGALGDLHQAADAAHLLAAGWWIGGLLALAVAIRGAGEQGAAMLARFSGVGYLAVATIVATGLVKSALLLGSVSAIATSAYGGVLMLKLGLFTGMGLLALSNRFQVTPALQRGEQPQRAVRRLRVQVGAELALGLAVLAVVAVLGAMTPPISA